jgi:hypothetical protein
MYLSTQILMHFYFIKSQEYSLIMNIVCYYGVEFFFNDFKKLFGLDFAIFQMMVQHFFKNS